MVRDILRFNRQAPSVLEAGNPSLTLGEYLRKEGYSEEFCENYIIPMGAAVWSSPRESILGFPAVFFIRFFKNHGMLSVNDRPQWYTIRGGSRTYVERITAPFRDRIRVSCPVTSIRRFEDCVRVEAVGCEPESFDEVIVATHSDEALTLLADASDGEREVLGSIPYQPNATVLHTDTRIMPRRRLAWASWNYHIPDRPQPDVTVTYDMNILQALQAEETFLVTLNESELLDPQRMLGQFEYSHPQFSTAAYAAQQRWAQIDGVRRTRFCGAYWRYGFHEDGVVSALRVCEAYGRKLNGG
jgi:predicted NAD/FAD-binding protein